MNPVFRLPVGKAASPLATLLLSLYAFDASAQSSCAPPPAGLVGWWRGEGNAKDSFGTNDGRLVGGVGFVPGKVGQAFSFTSVSSGINLGNPSSFQLQNFTLEAWIKRASATRSSWDIFGIAHVLGGAWGGYGMGLNDKGNVFLSKIGYSNVYSTNAVTDTNGFHHLVVTKSGSTVTFYIDGKAETAAPYDPGFVFNGTFAIGARGSDYNSTFLGAVDEASIYDRALTGAEALALYQASSAGKCVGPTAPTIFTQPGNQITSVGGTANFVVAAGGSAPLAYQWEKNGVVINGATGSTLTLANVQVADVGSYLVVVSNSLGSTTSSNATLTLQTNCARPPAGLVSWWQAEGNAIDSVGGNNGILHGGVSFVAGKVGHGFGFDGTCYIVISNSPTLTFTNQLTIELWYLSAQSNSVYYTIIDKRVGAALANYGINNSPINGLGVFYDDPTVEDGDDTPFGSVFEVSRYSPAPAPGAFHHLAATYQQLTNSQVQLQTYVDGQLVRTRVIKGNLANTVNTSPITIGAAAQGAGEFFKGVIDEISIYDRVLTASEVQAIYNAGSIGKCSAPITPSFIEQPLGQNVPVGANASFTAVAAGSIPLGYQWQKNGLAISGASSSTFSLTNVQLANAGVYSVIVSNAAGTVTSSGATLTVNAAEVCVPAPAGLVSWWRGEGNSFDSEGPNSGTFTNPEYAPGEVGQAFNFDFTGNNVRIPASQSLDVGAGAGLTIEAWINSTDNTYGRPIFEWVSKDVGGYAVHFFAHQSVPGALYADLYDTANNHHMLQSAAGLVLTNVFQHVAVTYDKASGLGRLFINGALVQESLLGTFTPQTSPDALIGYRPNTVPFGPIPFLGRIDEVSLYSRALSPTELQAIYTAGSAGKCFAPSAPVVLVQPTNQSVTLGTNASFSVTAQGTPPLFYQWYFNATNVLAFATNSSLVLSNVSPALAGSYQVVVSNSLGSITSSIAALTVNATSSCATPPLGLISWWRAEGSAQDAVGTNNGSLMNGASFAAGEVGSAFSFNGARAFVEVPDSPSLRLTNELTVELWYKDTGSPTGGYYGLIAKRAPYANGSNFGIDMHIGSPNILQVYIQDPHYAGYLTSVSQLPTAGVFHHVAATYRQATLEQVELKTYIDGQLVQTGTVNGNLARTLNNAPVTIGADDPNETYFVGVIDEPSIYNRALSASEIQAIYNAGSAGKCTGPTAPVVLVQPTNQVAALGGNASFSVTAGGTPPLTYQWLFGGVSLPGATSSTLALTDVQYANAGAYSVIVSNSLGTTTSSSATLTVTAPPPCAPVPAGLVSWWRAEGTAQDSVGNNNGMLMNGASFTTGEVGSGFSFNGARAFVQVPDSPSLRLTNELTVELWYKDTGCPPGGVYGLMAKRAPYPSGCNFGVNLYLTTPSVLQVYIQDPNYSSYQVSASPVPAPGLFHHLAATYRQAAPEQIELKTYVDGRLIQTGTVPGNLARTLNNASVTIGSDNPNEAYLVGVIDEPSIYNRALTATEIQAIYNAGAAGKCGGPVPPTTSIQVSGTTAQPGSTVTVPINLVANGKENAVGFSLNFDPTVLTYVGTALGSGATAGTLLTNPGQAPAGRVGIAVALPAGVTFPTGTQQVVLASFTAVAVTNPTSTTIGFGDAPILRQVADALGNPVPVGFVSGTVIVGPTGFEGDVYPRPNGDQALTISDWVLEGRYVARLDYPTNASEFQRADCAPRSTGGDGQLTVADWVQVGRYVAGLDPLTRVGAHPVVGPAVVAATASSAARKTGSNPRQVKIVAPALAQGQTGIVEVALEAQGDENALAFSLNFDASRLVFTGATSGDATSGATLNVNTSQAAQGHLGCVLALQANQSFAAGTRQLVKVSFHAAAAASGLAVVSFSDQPVPRGVSDPKASALTADYIAAAVVVNPLPRLKITQSAKSLSLSWPASAAGFLLQESSDPAFAPTSWTVVPIASATVNGQSSVVVQLSSTNKFYRLYHP